LVIEILSPGKENRDRDLLVKRQLYGKYGVGEYWSLIVRIAGRSYKWTLIGCKRHNFPEQ